MGQLGGAGCLGPQLQPHVLLPQAPPAGLRQRSCQPLKAVKAPEAEADRQSKATRLPAFLTRLALDASNIVPKWQRPGHAEDARDQPSGAELRGDELTAQAGVVQRPSGGSAPAEEEHPALQLLLERMRSGSRPGARTDRFKLGLAVEGGGMRGCVSAGGLRALHDLGAKPAFDAVYGSSAGAINSTYFLSGQRHGVEIYPEDISTAEFIDMRRLLSWSEGQRPALDLTFLLDHVMQHVKPLDWEAVLRSDVPLKVVACCLDTLQPVILEDFQDAADLRTCLRAGATVPAVAGPPVVHRGRRLVDAAVLEPVPFRAAISDGCTHVITLCSRSPANSSGWLEQRFLDATTEVVKRAIMSPDYMKAAWAQELANMKAWGQTTDQMIMLALQPDSQNYAFLDGCFMLPILPGRAAELSPICLDVPSLQAGIRAGEAAVMQTVGARLHQPPRVDALYQDAGLEANGMEPIAYRR